MLLLKTCSARLRLVRPPHRRLCTSASEAVLIAAPPMMRVVDLHRPAALNALNHEMVNTLLPLVQNWQQLDGDVKLVVFRGAGNRAFCAGGDIRYLHQCAMTGTPEGRAPAIAFFKDEYTLNHAIGTSRTPIVTILNGIVMGGGVGLSVHGHVRVATDATTFAMPETGLGFFPDVGGTYFLPRLRGSLGMYLGLTGARLRGRDVASAGIATHFVPGARIEALEMLLLELAGKTKGKAYTLESNQDFIDLDVLGRGIASLDQLAPDSTDGSSAASPPPQLNEQMLAEVDDAFSRDEVGAIVDAVQSMAATAPDQHHWALAAARELARASPTALAVTHEALRRGKACASLAECLQMEFRIAQRFLKHPDFVAGVGAVLSKGAEPATWSSPPSKVELEEWFVAGDGGELVLP